MKESRIGTHHDKAATAIITNHRNHRIMVELRVNGGGVKRSEQLWWKVIDSTDKMGKLLMQRAMQKPKQQKRYGFP